MHHFVRHLFPIQIEQELTFRNKESYIEIRKENSYSFSDNTNSLVYCMSLLTLSRLDRKQLCVSILHEVIKYTSVKQLLKNLGFYPIKASEYNQKRIFHANDDKTILLNANH